MSKVPLNELLDEMCGIQAAYETAGIASSKRLDVEMVKVRKKIHRRVEEIREAAANDWISVSERLPGDNDHVQVWEHGRIAIMHFVVPERLNPSRGITHWMPCPRAPAVKKVTP